MGTSRALRHRGRVPSWVHLQAMGLQRHRVGSESGSGSGRVTNAEGPPSIAAQGKGRWHRVSIGGDPDSPTKAKCTRRADKVVHGTSEVGGGGAGAGTGAGNGLDGGTGRPGVGAGEGDKKHYVVQERDEEDIVEALLRSPSHLWDPLLPGAAEKYIGLAALDPILTP